MGDLFTPDKEERKAYIEAQKGSTNENKTYVYAGSEVKLTGRTAEREVNVQRQDVTGRRTRIPVGTDLLYEITPSDQSTGSWKKWVKINELYKIKD